jgi:hypothetical protein
MVRLFQDGLVLLTQCTVDVSSHSAPIVCSEPDFVSLQTALSHTVRGADRDLPGDDSVKVHRSGERKPDVSAKKKQKYFVRRPEKVRFIREIA